MVNRVKYLEQYNLLANKQEDIMRKALKRAINSYIRTYAKVYQQSVVGFAEDILFSRHAKELSEILATRYRKIIPQFSKLALSGFIDDITKDESDILINQQDRLVSNYVLSFAVTRARQIAKTSVKRIRTAVDNGIKEGLPITEIAGFIRGVITTTDARAELIARTEVHTATNYASIETARTAEKQLNIKMQKEWIATNDKRTRDTHANIDGVVKDIDELFDVGAGRGERPLDPNLPTEEIMNCRCSLIYRKKKYDIE